MDRPTAHNSLAGRSVRVTAIVAAVLWASVIFSFSSMPGSDVPGRYGTLAHFVEYAVFAALLRVGLRGTSTRGDEILLAIAIASAYGVTDELHQAFVTLRVPDVIDWLVDTAGAMFGALAAEQLLRALARGRGRRENQ